MPLLFHRLVTIKKEVTDGHERHAKTKEDHAKTMGDLNAAREDVEEGHELQRHLILSENNKMTQIDRLNATVQQREAELAAVKAELRKTRDAFQALERVNDEHKRTIAAFEQQVREPQ